MECGRPGGSSGDLPLCEGLSGRKCSLKRGVIVPIEAVLFRSGGIQSIQNVIGVGFVGWQWVLVNRLLAGARRSSGEGEI